ncbi:MAG: DUF6443 domain-containing protein [Spirosomaceae bacterium]|jgi:RHS repeat-associated protein|nr:DUF6443 domain-containing protein [Spirosomataceae bacterium]
MKKVILLLILVLVNLITFAQQVISVKVANHGYPPVRTFTPEELKQFESNKPTNLGIPTISSFGNLPSGIAPAAPPEAADINRFKDIAVNQFTGTAIVPLPLYNLQEGALNVPIALNYNASGMKLHEVASWSGMNWSLMAGGMITRQVRGIPDEGKFDINTWSSSYERKGYYWYGYTGLSTVDDDTEPDVFYMNINGQSYKFMYKYSGVSKFIFFPDTDIEIIPIFEFDGTTDVGKFTRFDVLMPDGTKYVFGDGAYEKSTEVDVKTAQDENIYPGASRWNHFWKNESVTSAWYLRKIITPYGQEINFTYDVVQYSFFKLAESQSSGVCPTPAQVDKRINKVYVEGASLGSITTDHKKVEFNRRFRECFETESGNEICYINAPPRLDLDSWDENPTSQSNAKKLVEMTVMDKVNPTDTLKYQFDYGHFTGFEDDLPSGYTHDDVGYSHTKRLRLEKVTFPDKTTYRFRYNGDSPTFNGKSRLNYGIDHWGFPNGSTGNRFLTGLIPRDSFFSGCTPNTSNRETNIDFAFYGSLDSVVVSTGSYTKFIYELHEARNYKNSNGTYKPIGGARIKEIKNKDLISGIETIKSYSYVLPDTRPSGFLSMKPIYRFKNNFAAIGANSGIYDRLFAEIGRPVVGYTRVVEQIKNNIDNTLGKTIYTFDHDTTEITTERIVVNCTGEYPNQICDTTYYYQPERIKEGVIVYHDFKSGNPIRTEILNQNGDTLSVQTFAYTTLQGNSVDNTFSSKVFKVNGYNLGYASCCGGVFLEEYSQLFKRYHLEKQTSKVFSQNGTNPITTIQEFTYKDEILSGYHNTYPGQHNFLVKIESSDGQNHQLSSLTKYIADFNFGLDTVLIPRICYDPEYGTPYNCDTTEYFIHVPRLGTQARAIYEMQRRHILTPTIEIVSKNGTRVAQAAFNRYDSLNVTTNSQFGYFLKESFALNNIGEAIFSDVIYNRVSDDSLVRDTNFYPIVEYQDYNNKGFSKKVKGFGASINGTDYDTAGVLPIRSINNIGGVVIDTTQYEYETKIFGLSKQISPNKLAINYKYYTDSELHKVGQLKQITDKDGYILSHYEYPYFKQNLINTSGTFNTDTTKNRVVVRSPRDSTRNVYQDYQKVSTSVSYSDGSGRTLQSVAYKASPKAKDLLSSTPEYDTFGRPQKNILPVVSPIATGNFQSGSQSLAQTFYNDTAPYSEVTQYENSPLSRAFKGIGVGAAFRPNRETEQKFETGNFGIAKYELDYNGNLNINTYSGNQILKTVGIDEQQQAVISYSDKDGRILEKHVQFTGDGTSTSHYLITTYVYDYLGRLALIIPPKMYGVIPDNTNIASSSYLVGVYMMKYDKRNRIIEKHTPDAGWSYVVYNRLGQIVLEQDARIRTNNQWRFSKYDAYGRMALAGILPNNSTRATLQATFDTLTLIKQYEETTPTGGILGYTNRSFPSSIPVIEPDVMVVNYYDDYSWKPADTLNFVPYRGVKYGNVKGLQTGNQVRRLDTQAWLRTAMYYDDQNRLIQSQAENRFGDINQNDFVFDFIGQLLEERTLYRKPTGSIPYSSEIESKTTYQYDHVGRKTQAIHYFTGHSPELLATYEYDEIGRMIRKNLNEAQKDSIIRQNETLNNRVIDVAKKYILLKPGTTILPDTNYLAFIGSGIQKVDYSYNIRGNLRGINLTPAGKLDSSKVFSMKLDYFEDGRYFDGNLSKQSWKTSRDTTLRSFTYDYDKSQRYTKAAFKGKTNEKYDENVAYDANGNIEKLNRFGLESTNNWQRIDSLSYIYPTYQNQLTGLTDAANDNIGFKEALTGGVGAYTYYPDGSLKTDANKGIDSIRYNYLGLPSHIFFDTDKYIENVYTADGQKLYQKIVNGSSTIRTDYVGSLLYRNDTLTAALHDEGKIRFDTLGSHYQYFINDHLGNTRVIFEKLNDSVYIAQENHYSPFGTLLEGIGVDSSWQWLYQSQEYIDAFGYNSYDFHARGYDANTGRFDGIDPVDNYALSGYAGMMNNPLSYIDPDGRNPVLIAMAIGAFMGGHISGTLSVGKGKSYWGGFGKGAITGAVGGILGFYAPIGILPGMAYGAGSGAITGTLGAALNGNNIGRGALMGAIGGSIFGGISGGLQADKLGANIWTGYREPHLLLASEVPAIKGGEEAPYTNEYLKEMKDLNFSDVKGVSNISKDWMPKSYKVNSRGSFTNSKGDDVLAVTYYRVWKGGSKQSIFFSKASFASKELLAYTMTHEMGHVIHNNLGLSSEASEKALSGLLDTEGHVAIQGMTLDLIKINKWQLANFPSQATNFLGTRAEASLLNPIKQLARIIIFPK